MACDPKSLLAGAAPLQGIPENSQLSVLIYLLCQILANGGTGKCVQDWTATDSGGNTVNLWKQFDVGPGPNDVGNIGTLTFNGQYLDDFNNGDVGRLPSLGTLNFPNLIATGTGGNGNIVLGSNANLQTVNIPQLQTVGLSIHFSNCDLRSFLAPKLTSIGTNGGGGDAIDCNSNANLTTVDLSSLILANTGQVVDFQFCALNVASVNLILRRGVISGVTNCDFELAGGTNAPPAGQGVIDKATLQGLGNTVNTN